MRRPGLKRPHLPLFLATGLALVSAPAGATSPPVPTPDQINAQIEQAEQLRQTAAEHGAEWLETESLIQKARKAAAAEDWHTARQLAERAKRQSELAIEQSERESTAWQKRAVR